MGESVGESAECMNHKKCVSEVSKVDEYVYQ